MILERLTKIISEQLDISDDKITNDSSFQDDFGADSLDIVELIMALEDEFELEIEDEEAENLKTVGDAVEYIQNHIDDIE